ncbi:helix-turn-helix domain-containing protein [Leucobacter aridicollis]|uniref:helix-turn-helix domain-containing protein n=1 Tax=Leucobacter aridicollis TaxID=283878 RepID=UPI00210588FD|nr:helix-turn-helix domain-containing protein [Leucobacter aridicollis]UTX53393.1 helix-turn-helix domain-containing protein [Leucobacter aridicollis]
MTLSTLEKPRFYFVGEVATELRRSEAAVRWLIHTGRIKTGKLGGRTVIAAAELDRFIEEAFNAADA